MRLNEKIVQHVLTGLCLSQWSKLTVNAVNVARFNTLVGKLEKDTLEFRDKIELYYHVYRCDETQLSLCQANNIHECRSTLPSATCSIDPNFAFNNADGCGQRSQGCGSLVDFKKSVYQVPPGTDEIDDKALTEDVCYTRFMDDYLVGKRAQDASYWEPFGMEPRSHWFGSVNGMFRIFPGRSGKECAFDPRLRPWYVAGSSGAKNIVMVLDKSGSMLGARLSLMNEAAKRIISDTLTDRDRVAIVFFDEEIKIIADQDQFLFQATQANKEKLLSAIDKVEARGQTNFYDAFAAAFDILDNSLEEEFNADCNSALLFLTDGEMTHPDNVNATDVIDLINTRSETVEKASDHSVVVLTYSVSETENVHELPKQIACSVKLGAWSRIDRPEGIVSSLTSYYLLFALGVGSSSNKDFTAWAPPYEYVPSGLLGTTVSAPVFDRSKTPHLFLGVVGIGILMDTLSQALETTNSSEAVERLARRAVASCPNLSLDACQLESYRAETGGAEARCMVSDCSEDDFVETVARQCTDTSKYPLVLTIDEGADTIDILDRVCCIEEDPLFPGGTKESCRATKTVTDGDSCSGFGCHKWAFVALFLGGISIGAAIAVIAVRRPAVPHTEEIADEPDVKVGHHFSSSQRSTN